MRRTEALARLRTAEPEMRTLGIAALYLFGSVSRDEAHLDSDVDVFVDPQDETRFGFDAFMRSYDRIQQALPGQLVGYTTRNGLAPFVRAAVEREAIRVF